MPDTMIKSKEAKRLPGLQTGGFIQQYEGLTFMTVRGAGHEVPFYRPEAAFAMFSAWLSGNVNATTVPVFYTHVEDYG